MSIAVAAMAKTAPLIRSKTLSVLLPLNSRSYARGRRGAMLMAATILRRGPAAWEADALRRADGRRGLTAYSHIACLYTSDNCLTRHES